MINSSHPISASIDKNLPSLIFEYPLKPQVRGFLRLELLFQQFDRNRLASHGDNHLHALRTLFEILEILERGDTRSELIKELTRLADVFANLRENEVVDTEKLENFLKQVNQLRQWVFDYQGKFGDSLRRDPFIESVRNRINIPGGTSQFDSPDLFLFLSKPIVKRQTQFEVWLSDIKGVKTSVDVILKIMRDNARWQSENAPMGSFMIDTAAAQFQLLRVKLSPKEPLFPEFSCGRHRSSIHFMRYNQQHRKVPLQQSIDFELACCS